MNKATVTKAADKRPEDFLPPPAQKIEKRVTALVVTRANGEVETTALILRPGDVATIDGKTVAEF